MDSFFRILLLLFYQGIHHTLLRIIMGWHAPIYSLGLLVKHVMREELEIRRVQAYSGDRSLTIVLPKIFSEKLNIEKGDFLKVQLENGKLIVEKAEI